MTEAVSDERIEFKYSIKLNEVNKFQQKLSNIISKSIKKERGKI